MAHSLVTYLSAASTRLVEIETDVLVIAVALEEDGPRILHDDPALTGMQSQLAKIGVTAKRDEITRIPAPGNFAAGSIALLGLGSGGVNSPTLRMAAGALTRHITGVESITFAVPTPDADVVAAIAEGALLGTYRYTGGKSKQPEPSSIPASKFSIVGTPDADEVAFGLDRAVAIADSAALVKELVLTPPADLAPANLAARAIEEATALGATVQEWTEAELARDGFGGILGVGQGSSRPPRLVKISYAPAGAERHLALVGKGITFDSGGLSLKPASSMVGMKYDMTGAATVLGAILAVIRLNLPVRVTAWMCIAENLPSGTAMRPNDVITVRGGKTIEVLNTDAEGRLVLADGLVAASEEQPDLIVDVATLTGAATVALGTRTTAVMGNVRGVSQIMAASKAAEETFWAMPLPSELRALLDSDVADIANAKPGNTAAGMLLAGVFLREFVGTDNASAPLPWAHLDIAGTAYNKASGYGFTAPGPTAVALRTLVRLGEQMAANSAEELAADGTD